METMEEKKEDNVTFTVIYCHTVESMIVSDKKRQKIRFVKLTLMGIFLMTCFPFPAGLPFHL